jgi:asparagine synthase (glutamine-hydrolysing)
VYTKRVVLDFAELDGVQPSPGRVEVIGQLWRDAEPTMEDPWRDIQSALRESNGFFSVAGVTRAGDVFAAADRVRSRPVFYANLGAEVIVGTDPYRLLSRLDSEGRGRRSPFAAAEFLLCGYVTGSDTLHPDLKQLRAGEVLIARRLSDGYDFGITRYFQYRSTADIDKNMSWESATGELNEMATVAVSRLIEYANGAPIVIPLSGGRDSRLIAIKLKELDYGDVYCYTYGSLDGLEARVSREVAKQLGHRWLFVPYSQDTWRNLRQNAQFARYQQRAHMLSSVAYIQDWPAAGDLRRYFPSRAVFAPGHSHDFLAGSHIPWSWSANRSVHGWPELERALLKKHFSLWPRIALAQVFGEQEAESLWRSMALRRRESLRDFDLTDLEGLVQAFEHWDWSERQAKFIVNSVRGYEDHGYDWWLPWWDNRAFEFWGRVPLEFRLGKRLLNEYVDGLQRSYGIEGLPGQREDAARRFIATSAIGHRLMAGWHGLKRVRGTRALKHTMSWQALVEEEIARWPYSGIENINSYLSRAYVSRDVGVG